MWSVSFDGIRTRYFPVMSRVLYQVSYESLILTMSRCCSRDGHGDVRNARARRQPSRGSCVKRRGVEMCVDVCEEVREEGLFV